MQIKKINRLREKIIFQLIRVINKLDNIGNADCQTNGEKDFLEGIIRYYDKKKFIVFDVGANVGEYSEILLSLIGLSDDYNFHLFEPQRSCIEELRDKFKNNDRIVLNDFGLSDENGILTLYKNKEKSALGSLYKRNLDFYDTKMEEMEQVSLKTAKDYIENRKIEKINLLKIDVEGHELKAFAGFGKYLNPDFIDFIQFEYGGANIDSHTNLLDFYSLLSSKGFKICKIMHGYLEVRDYNPRYDNFIYQNYVAVSEKVIAGLSVI